MIHNGYFDGAIDENPGGNMGIGACINLGIEKEVWNHHYISIKHSRNSNNVAEYLSLIALLDGLLDDQPEIDNIIIHGDSQLVIKQITGEFKVKEPYLKVLKKRASDKVELLREMGTKIRFKWIPREYNKRADELSKLALRKALKTPID